MKVGIGPVFEGYGGVKQHILEIQKFSSHDVRTVPPKAIGMIVKGNDQSARVYRTALSMLGLRGYDIVHSHASPWLIELCAKSKKRFRKWVHTYHTLNFEEDMPQGLSPAQKKTNRYLVEKASKADVKISVSKWLHDYLLETHSIETQVVPNGINLEACMKANPNSFSEKWTLGEFVLFVGNSLAVKNPGVFAELAKQMPEINFAMIGRGLGPNCLKALGTGGIPKNLFPLGEQTHQETLDAISACKAFVMTSKREGAPTTLLEAMALSKPVVAPNHSGCKEIVKSGDYGFLYKPGSLEQLRKKTGQALKYSGRGKEARKRVSQKYDWKRLIKKIDVLYTC